MGMGFPFGSAQRSADKSTSSGIRLGRGGGSAPGPMWNGIPGDPNPFRFEIQTCEKFGPFVVAEIVWPDAKNFEGRKVAVYRCSPDELRKAKRLDPHFQEAGGPLAPVARFEPNEAGLDAARACARYLEKRRP